MSMVIGAIPASTYEPSDLGRNIKWHMYRRQLKADVLAKDAGIGRNTLQRMCYLGGHSPTLSNIEKVAKALGVEAWELIIRPEDRDEI